MKNNFKNIKEAYENLFTNSEEAFFIKSIINLLIRNRLLVGSISTFFFAASFLFSLTLKQVWGGKFQIVIKEQDDQAIKTLPKLLETPFLKVNNSLNTKVEVLQSPSVLTPVFEFVKNKKNKLDDEYTFIKWKKNLDVQLLKNTTILDVNYKDEDKKIIIPVLNKISNLFEDYSTKERKRLEAYKRKYLTNQIDLFREKSFTSIEKAQRFAIDQDLFFLEISNEDLIPNQGEKIISNDLTNPTISIENIRVAASNEIRDIDSQLDKIKQLNEPDNIQYIASTIPALVNEGLPGILKEIDKELVELRSKYTDEDQSIINLLNKRELTINFLKKRAINILEASKLSAEAKMEAAMRPKDILLKYKKLVREAARDEATFIELENELRNFELIEATKQDTWQIITRPTLLKEPVGISKLRVIFIGTFLGLLIGIFLSIFNEKRLNIIFEPEDLKKYINTKLIGIINILEANENNPIVFLIQDFIFSQHKNKIIFITLGDFKKAELEKFKDLIFKDKNDLKIEFNSRIVGTKEENDKFILIKLGAVKHNELKNFKSNIDLLKYSFKGMIIFK